MTIFELMLYSCIRYYDFSGSLTSMNCDWRSSGLYTTIKSCADEGDTKLGQPIHEFGIIIGTVGRKVEKIRCDSRQVKND